MNRKIYFAACNGRIKVGIAQDVIARVRQIGEHLSDPIEIIGVIPGDHKQEKAIHAALRDHRLKGEWFRDCENVRRLLRDFMLGAPTPPTLAIPKVAKVKPLAFRGLVRLAFPVKPVACLQHLTGAARSTIHTWLSGEHQPPASVLAVVMGELMRRLAGQ